MNKNYENILRLLMFVFCSLKYICSHVLVRCKDISRRYYRVEQRYLVNRWRVDHPLTKRSNCLYVLSFKWPKSRPNSTNNSQLYEPVSCK